MGDSIGRDSSLRSVLESCRKVLEVGTSKKNLRIKWNILPRI